MCCGLCWCQGCGAGITELRQAAAAPGLVAASCPCKGKQPSLSKPAPSLVGEHSRDDIAGMTSGAASPRNIRMEVAVPRRLILRIFLFLTSGDINEDTLETENAAAAAAAAFTASTHLKEAVLGRFSPSCSPLAAGASPAHCSVGLREGTGESRGILWAHLHRCPVPEVFSGLPPSRDSVLGFGRSLGLGDACWSVAALSWCRLRPVCLLSALSSSCFPTQHKQGF